MAERIRQKVLRCAIYTRKSSEEGLEQEFNSLHAQREACEAYIKSQVHEGWRAIADPYDDGGYSGGTMERPSLKALLADVHARKVDVVVVYKVDRLTRALNDFARIVEVFDAQSVSFVSVTQQFNTTTSMGRLTLNVLLSFAQFEREVTGERIRDKIAASKKKGMWMGGLVPIGYDAKDRSLVINEPDAAIVREIFRLYLGLGSVISLKAELDGRAIRTRQYMTVTGRAIGGRPFSHGHLYKLLSNPLYIGEIRHRGARHAGLHPAIIDLTTWDSVQAQLASNTRARLQGTRSAHPSLLSGKLFDGHGNRLFVTHATKNGKRYRYYVAAAGAAVLRLAAAVVEPLVMSEIATALGSQHSLVDRLGLRGLKPAAIKTVFSSATNLATAISRGNTTERRIALSALVERITVDASRLEIELRPEVLLGGVTDAQRDGDTGTSPFLIGCPFDSARDVSSPPLVLDPAGREAAVAGGLAPPELKGIARGFVWLEELTGGKAGSIEAVAKRDGVTDRYVSRLIDQALDFALAASDAVSNLRERTGNPLTSHPRIRDQSRT
jgi:DNA invertase Pin-like site-specific DNA recombinase